MTMELKDVRERAGMTALLTDVLESMRLAREVFITLGQEGQSLCVRADSEYLVVSSGYGWLDDFEANLTRRANALMPHAQVDFDWVDADGDRDVFVVLVRDEVGNRSRWAGLRADSHVRPPNVR